MSKGEALALQSAVDEILSGAHNQGIEGAINWADLHCVDVMVSALDGMVVVVIEEASPDAVQLHAYVVGELAQLGYEDVLVTTEW